MMALPFTRLQAKLAVICAALAALIVVTLAVPIPDWQGSPVHLMMHQGREIAPDEFQAPPPDSFASIETRPVFSPTRAPIHGEEGGAGESGALLDLTLVGVILDGGARFAVLRSPAHPLATAVALGATIDGWQVTLIENDHVVVRGEGSEHDLRLNPASAVPPPQPTPVPQQQPPPPQFLSAPQTPAQ